MSTFTTSLAVLGLAAIGVVGWQTSRPEPGIPNSVQLPADPTLATALPGLPALPTRISFEAPRDHLVLPPDLGRNGLPCGLQVRAEAAPPAMVELQIRDACRPDTRVEIAHAGLSIVLMTNAQGEASLTLPALSDPARLEVSIAGVLTDATTVPVPDLGAYHRAALAWRGPSELALHAHEHGAADLSAGHIRPGAAGQRRDAILGQGGHLAVLGSAEGQAQIYTYPRDAVSGYGRVRLSVLQASCGQTTMADRFELGPEGTLSHTTLRIAAPDCGSAIAQTRLQNLYQDLRIAAQ